MPAENIANVLYGTDGDLDTTSFKSNLGFNNIVCYIVTACNVQHNVFSNLITGQQHCEVFVRRLYGNHFSAYSLA